MVTLTPTTELEAVNYLLEAIEEEAVNTLLGNGDPDVSAAILFISQSSRTLQVTGWEFNTEPSFVLNPDISGQIVVPENIIKLTVPGKRYAVRNRRLFDRDDQSYSFTEQVTAEVIQLLSFEELPEMARNFVVMDAAFKFQAKRAPDELIARLTREDVNGAWIEFVADDTRSSNFSFSHNQEIQNRVR